MSKTTKIKLNKKLPKVEKNLNPKGIDEFPLGHYSYSTFVKFSTNPIMFKINYINGDRIDTTSNISGVIGKTFHNAMAAYFQARETEEESSAIQIGLEAGMQYISEYGEGFIEYSTSVANKQKAQEIFSFAFNSYITDNEQTGDELISCEELLEEEVNVEWQGQKLDLPVKLKGYTDKIIKTKDGKIKIIDYKTTRAFSNPEKLDGSKIIQAIQYFLLVYARYGQEPYSMIFEEIKLTKNRDGTPQMKKYEIVYKDNNLFFDVYFRFYEDITKAINGEAVFVPNIMTFFDNEISIMAYAHRLDQPEELAKTMEKEKVKNITELLKSKIHNAGNMKKFLKTAEKKFITAKNLNYESMKNEEKIKTKLMEHGMMLQFDSVVEGCNVDLYRFNPSIGLKMSKLKGFTADIEQVMGVAGVRVLAPIPNTSLIGFEVPKADRTFPSEPPKTDDFNLAFGVDVMGNTYRFDIRKAPHLLIAGATGSGKSVFLNSIISQLSQLDNVDLHLFDPKIVELAQFQKIAKEYHNDIESIYLALEGLVEEMNNRYKQLAKAGVNNIKDHPTMRYKFIVIDEFGDLTISNVKDGKTNLSKEIQKNILLLAQKARACGIHIIIATQRPSVDIITGTIRANFPTKVAFRMAKAIDSQILLDEDGAEKLLGRGDMIFSSDEGQIRLQGYKI